MTRCEYCGSTNTKFEWRSACLCIVPKGMMHQQHKCLECGKVFEIEVPKPKKPPRPPTTRQDESAGVHRVVNPISANVAFRVDADCPKCGHTDIGMKSRLIPNIADPVQRRARTRYLFVCPTCNLDFTQPLFSDDPILI